MSYEISIGGRSRRIGTAVATAGNSNAQVFDFSRGTFTVFVDYTGTISTASIQLQASPNPYDTTPIWFNIGTASTTTTDHTFSVTGIAVQAVRVGVTITGGGTADLYLAAI